MEHGLGVRTIAIINQKGGSGKTTTAINLAACLARRGSRVLLVDLDPQSHCALGLAVPESQIDLTIADAMLAPDNRPPERSRLVWEAARGLDLIPSNTRLAGLEAQRGGLAERIDRDRRLAIALSHLSGTYDWCFLDCPPFIGLLTFNALRAADEVLIPVETGYFALQGAMKQVNTIRALGRKAGVLTPFRVLPTLHDPSSALASEILGELQRRFEANLVPCVIRFDLKLKESVSAGVAAAQFDAESSGSQDYTALAQFYETAPRLQAEVVAPPASAEGEPAHESRAEPAPPLTLVRSETSLPRFSGVASRAAELAERARRLSARSAEITQRLESDPQVARVLHELDQEAAGEPAPSPHAFESARVTSRGVLFLHRAGPDAHVEIEVAPSSVTMIRQSLRFRREHGHHEVLLSLPPGPARFRFVVDGAPVSSSGSEPWGTVVAPLSEATSSEAAAISA